MAKAGDVIENPITGERITFFETAQDTNGEIEASPRTRCRQRPRPGSTPTSCASHSRLLPSRGCSWECSRRSAGCWGTEAATRSTATLNRSHEGDTRGTRHERTDNHCRAVEGRRSLIGSSATAGVALIASSPVERALEVSAIVPATLVNCLIMILLLAPMAAIVEATRADEEHRAGLL